MSDFDFRLKAALKEIEKVLDKYELGGLISLHSKTHAEYRFVVPAWAVFKIEYNDKGQFKFKVSHHEKHGANIQSSYGFLLSSRDICQNHVNLVTNAVNQLIDKKALIMEKIPQGTVLRTVSLDDMPEGHPI